MGQPIRLEVVRWKCPGCRKSYSDRSRTVAHVANCWQLPENRGCKTCGHADGPNSDYVDYCGAGVDLTARECDVCRGDGSNALDFSCSRCGGTGIMNGPALPIVRCPLWVASDE
jgi:hypothetical protein